MIEICTVDAGVGPRYFIGRLVLLEVGSQPERDHLPLAES